MTASEWVLGPAAGTAGFPGSVTFGPGTVRLLPEVVRRYAPRRVLLVGSRRGIAATGLAELLEPWEVELFTRFSPNPGFDEALRGCARRDAGRAELIIGVGGGSAMDVAKAVRTLPADRAEALACLEGTRPPGRADRPPLILLPTTAGTGSEVTRFATVFVGLDKRSLDHALVAPDRTIVDPELAATCPPSLVTSCVLDAFCHAVESTCNTRATDGSRAYARSALALLRDHLARDLAGGSAADRESRAVASVLAGRAIDITRTTAAHGFAYRMTSQFGIPHGVAAALNLMWLYDYNLAHAEPPAQASIRLVAELLGLTCDDVPAVVSQTLTANGWPARLSGYGITEDDLPELIRMGIGHRGRSDRNLAALRPDAVLRWMKRVL